MFAKLSTHFVFAEARPLKVGMLCGVNGYLTEPFHDLLLITAPHQPTTDSNLHSQSRISAYLRLMLAP
jgi:hypothetical protein